MTEKKWTILWNAYASDTYLYGSNVTFLGKRDVLFENAMMPPGTIIKRWYSKTNYQMQRIEPTLPMIDGETEYQISVSIDYPEGGTCLLRLEFFDKFEESAGYLIVKGTTMRFRCPLKTYSYRMELMNAGVSKFHFHYVTIKEVENAHE